MIDPERFVEEVDAGWRVLGVDARSKGRVHPPIPSHLRGSREPAMAGEPLQRPPAPVLPSGAAVALALDRAWSSARGMLPAIPATVRVVPWPVHGRAPCVASGPAGEVRLPSAALVGAETALAAILHAAVHVAAVAMAVDACDRTGRLHNRRFAALAATAGLDPGERDRTHGLPCATLSPEGRLHHQAALRALAVVLRCGPSCAPSLARGGARLVRATCGCGGLLRCSNAVLVRCQPTCRSCGTPFRGEPR